MFIILEHLPYLFRLLNLIDNSYQVYTMGLKNTKNTIVKLILVKLVNL